MQVGEISAPAETASNWFVYRLVAKEAPNPADLATQKTDIEQQLLQSKQSAAFEAFHTSLIDRLKKEGKLTIHPDVANRITSSS